MIIQVIKYKYKYEPGQKSNFQFLKHLPNKYSNKNSCKEIL